MRFERVDVAILHICDQVLEVFNPYGSLPPYCLNYSNAPANIYRSTNDLSEFLISLLGYTSIPAKVPIPSTLAHRYAINTALHDSWAATLNIFSCHHL